MHGSRTYTRAGWGYFFFFILKFSIFIGGGGDKIQYHARVTFFFVLRIMYDGARGPYVVLGNKYGVGCMQSKCHTTCIICVFFIFSLN